MKRRQLLEGLNAFFRRSVKSDYLFGSEVLRSSNLQKIPSCTSELSRLKRFNRHSFLVSRLETWGDGMGHHHHHHHHHHRRDGTDETGFGLQLHHSAEDASFIAVWGLSSGPGAMKATGFNSLRGVALCGGVMPLWGGME